MPRELRESVVLITGASAGIGLVLARGLHAAGAKLVLAARRLDRLEQLNAELGRKHLCVRCDVSISAECGSLIDQAARHFGRLDTLVCNAGYGLVRRVHEMSDEEFDAMWRTNVVGTTACIRAAVPQMRRNEIANAYRGQIMIVSSAAARRGLPFFGAYSATKAAQLSLAEACRVELKSDRIAVTSVHPIGTDTDFFKAAELLSAARIDVPSRSVVRQTSEQVVAKMIRAMRRPTTEVWPFRPSRIGLLLAALMPGMSDRVMRKALKEIEAAQGKK